MEHKKMTDEEAKAMIERLESLVDTLSLRVFIVKKSNYGRKASATPWQYVEDFTRQYGGDAAQIIAVFEGAGITDSVEAGRALLQWNKYVP